MPIDSFIDLFEKSLERLDFMPSQLMGTGAMPQNNDLYTTRSWQEGNKKISRVNLLSDVPKTEGLRSSKKS
jgi:hypothetical protein